MADHTLVELALDWLDSNWNTANYPGAYSGDRPALIDQDDTTGDTYNGRKVTFDLTKNNAVTVGSGPERQTTPQGTEYDFDVEDGVSVTVEGAHEDEFGHISDATEFQALVDEVQRALLVERTWPYRNASGDVHYCHLSLGPEMSMTTDEQDYFGRQFDLLYHGWEELP
jgi:hypothetical protein